MPTAVRKGDVTAGVEFYRSHLAFQITFVNTKETDSAKQQADFLGLVRRQALIAAKNFWLLNPKDRIEARLRLQAMAILRI
jgi:hypothetical protein